MLEVKMLADQPHTGGRLIADRELLLSADRLQVVEVGDPAGRFVLVGAGGTIPAEEAKRLKLRIDENSCIVQGAAKPEPKAAVPEAKEQPQPEDKERKKPADKAVKKPATKRRRKRAP